jgi:hypothetical protein
VCPRIGGSRNRASSRRAHPKSQMRTSNGTGRWSVRRRIAGAIPVPDPGHHRGRRARPCRCGVPSKCTLLTISRNRMVDPLTLQCYLEIASYMSQAFCEAGAASTPVEAAVLLQYDKAASTCVTPWIVSCSPRG